MRRGIIGLVLLLAVAALSGCAQRPAISVDEVESVTFMTLAPPGREWVATDREVARFVEAYGEAKSLSNANGTTPPARIDVELKNGETLTVWGGGQAFQTIRWRGKQSNIESDKLGALLEDIAQPR